MALNRNLRCELPYIYYINKLISLTELFPFLNKAGSQTFKSNIWASNTHGKAVSNHKGFIQIFQKKRLECLPAPRPVLEAPRSFSKQICCIMDDQRPYPDVSQAQMTNYQSFEAQTKTTRGP